MGVELLHTASLVHDDVVDESTERRGQASVNALYDNKVAVLYFRAIFVCYACVFLLNMNGREQHALRRHPLGQRRVRTSPA